MAGYEVIGDASEISPQGRLIAPFLDDDIRGDPDDKLVQRETLRFEHHQIFVTETGLGGNLINVHQPR